MTARRSGCVQTVTNPEYGRRSRWFGFARLGISAVAAALLQAAAMLSSPQSAAAQEMQFFRIGTGSTGGTYFPIGALIANAVSNPPGSRPCEEGGSCGVPGLVAVAVSTRGSVDNLRLISEGAIESALCQADIAFWAHTGTGLFEGERRFENIRAIANLYPESVHVVARIGSGIETLADLKGRPVSLDRHGSGTLVDARLILGAAGLDEDDVTAEYLDPEVAVDRLRDGSLDAFVFVGGYPVLSIAAAVEEGIATLVPIQGAVARELTGHYSFFSRNVIPASAYGLDEDIATISVGAQWVVDAGVDREMVYGLTRALWSDATQKLLLGGHEKGAHIRLQDALKSIAVPLHPGALDYYREQGLVGGGEVPPALPGAQDAPGD